MLAEQAEAEELRLSEEELRRLSRAMVDALLQRPEVVEKAVTGSAYVCVGVRVVVGARLPAELVDLDALASSTHGITDIIGQIAGFFRSILDSVAGWIVSSIQAFISGIVDTVSAVVGGITTAVSGFISGAVSTITGAIGGAISSITSAVSGFVSGAVSTLSSIISGIVSTVSTVVSSVISALSGAISAVASTISSALSAVASGIMGAISGAISAISGAISSVASALSGAISSVASAIMGAISGVVSAISSAISGFVGAISSAIGGVVKAITDSFAAVGRMVAEGLAALVKGVTDAVGAIARGIMDAVAGIGSGIAGLWNFLVGAFQDVAAKVGAGFTAIGQALTGFINSILTVGNWIMSALQKLGEWIWNALPDWLRDALTAIGDFFKGVVDAVLGFIKDPWGTLQKIASAVWEGLKWLGERIWEGVQFLGNLFMKGLESLWGWLRGGMEWLAKSLSDLGVSVVGALVGAVVGGFKLVAQGALSAVRGVVEFAIDVAKGVAEGLGKLITEVTVSLVKPMGETIGKAMEKPFGELVSELAEGKKTAGEWVELLQLSGLYLGGIIGSQYLCVGMWSALHALAAPLSKVRITLPVKIKAKGKGKATPAGVGAEGGAEVKTGAESNITINLGLVLRRVASQFRRYGDTFGRSLVYGMGIWFSQPLMRLASAAFRDWLVLELPTVETMTEITRRHMPHKEFEKVLERYRSFLRLYGYRTEIIDWLTSTELKIEVTDRFGIKRTVPISLMYELPSASDVATMMVRDIFPSIEEFQKLYSARGMHKDIGVLYYFLRFRYPPPERLWQFTVRGISGLLWATLPEEEKADIAKEVNAIGALMPVAPVDMNFQAGSLLSAFKTYMKWHDYFRGAWIKDFPSDNLIYIDTLADIPTKIDQRWMVKWGIYELLSAKQVTYQSTVKDFAAKVLEDKPTSEVKMDLTNFSRTLLATGLHPDWVPVTAVAEAMNVLTEERTALRTGFMGLFKEGFYDVEALEKMLGGFVTASFNVSYFDMTTMKWTTGWVNLPVMYLLPERRLLELRALMDRALDILREIQRDVSRAYQEFVVRDYNEYKAKLEQVIESINKFYAADYEAITGKKLPDELKLKFVEEYYKPYVAALYVQREVFTIRRVRMWTMRWLGWAMYRLAYGVVRKEDYERLVDYVKDRAKLTEYEAEFIRGIMELMYGIARRNAAAEYLPTPSTMAALSEYMTLDPDEVKRVLEERGIPEYWRGAWLTYIAVRPIKADAKALLSAYVRAFRYGAVAKDAVEAYVKELPKYGFTPKEVEFISRAVELEEDILEARENRREYVPTLLTLASMSEYVTVPEDLVKKVFDAKRVPAEWRPVWATYISVRPLADDVRGLLNAYRRALLYAKVPEDVAKKVKDYASLINFTDKEWDILGLRVALEELVLDSRENRREYIPTPMTLATIAELVPEARQFFDEVVAARRIPAEWKPLWAKYVDYRPLIDEVRRMLSRAEQLYAYFAVEEDTYKKVLDSVKYLGWTDKEIEFMLQTSRYERWLRAFRELVGDVDRMTMLAEYSPDARSFALGQLYKMIDAMPIDDATKGVLKKMWEQFIRIRPVRDEVTTYVRDVVNLYVAGLMTYDDLRKELEWLRQWGLDDYEIEFWLKIAEARRARKLKIPVVYAE
jgi:phage-related protein